MIPLRKRLKQNNLLAGLTYRAQMLLTSLREPLVRSRHRHPQPGSVTGGRGPRPCQLALCLRAKNEGRFLPEWIAHHVGLSFEHAYIYDNGSTDNTRNLLEPFIAAGLVTFLDWPHRPASPGCYHHFLENHGRFAEWVGFLDADEFLLEKSSGDLVRVLREQRSRPAIAVNWRYYGSSGHEQIPAGLVTENFTAADPGFDRHVKVLARPREILACRNSHNFFYRRLGTAVTPEGRPVFGSFAEPANDPVLYLNHYVYRSRQDYLRKAAAGFVDRSGASERARATGKAHHEFTRHNAASFRVPERYREKTRRLLAQLGYEPVYWQSGVPSDARIAST